MAKSPEEKIEELNAARQRITARIQTERAKMRKQSRKDDARRKIIVGAVVLAHAEHDAAFKNRLETLIEKYTTREADRKFLGLKPLTKNPANKR